MSRHAKTTNLITVAREILIDHHPMTVRQVYYQLVSRQVIENSRGQYQAVSKSLVAARQEGAISWDWIEDRLRRPRHVAMWDDVADFARVARQYRRNVWDNQPAYLECWLEKDALSGIVEDALEPYGVTLNVGRGYDGWDSIHNAAQRLSDGDTILYFGDFDPSGEDMVRSLGARLEFFNVKPRIIKCALTAGDIERYHLPPAFAKSTDSRRDAFVAKHGDISVELDALPSDVLRDRLIAEVESHMDLAALAHVREIEKAERQRLIDVMEAA
ncbi:MAG TPA: hypothetical protein VGG19_20670 [Tepidisphaeraceae bacterium]|jgi:hypothetical protein